MGANHAKAKYLTNSRLSCNANVNEPRETLILKCERRHPKAYNMTPVLIALACQGNSKRELRSDAERSQSEINFTVLQTLIDPIMNETPHGQHNTRIHAQRNT